MRNSYELELLKKLDAERRKWEEREDRLLKQLGTVPHGPSPTASTESRPMLDRDSTILPSLSSALLSQQLPPIGKFGGDNPDDGETFEEWLEMVASISCWDDSTKLANLASRLRGQAYAFCQSCTPQKRSDYNTLVAELTTRFMPVRLKAVQSSLFHDRNQSMLTHRNCAGCFTWPIQEHSSRRKKQRTWRTRCSLTSLLWDFNRN